MVDLALANPGIIPEELATLVAKRRRNRWILFSAFMVVFVLPAIGWVSWKLHLRGPSADQHYEQGVASLAHGDLQSALINFKNVLGARPKDADARLQLGNVYLLLGNGPAARKELEQAKTLGDRSQSLRLGLMRADFLQGEFKKVLAELAIRNSTTVAANLLKGDALLALDQLDQSERVFEIVLAQDADNIEALHGLSRVSMARGDLQAAAQHNTSAFGVSETDLSA